MIPHYDPAVQNLTFPSFTTFDQAKPKWLLVGSYPNRANQDTKVGGFFHINLMAPPFQLLPSNIYAEETHDLKHVLVYTAFDLSVWDLDAVECRIDRGEWNKTGNSC